MGGKKILVVDDDPDILKTTKYVLEDAGYEVYGAVDGEEGLKKMKEAMPDLILLDLILPGQDGFQVVRQIKSTEEYKSIPIIILSCRESDVDKHIAVKKGAIGYIVKPIDVERMLYQIKDALMG